MYFNPLFALLKDGRQVVVYSDNTDEGTVTIFPVADLPSFDAELMMFESILKAEVVRMDRDRDIAFSENYLMAAT
ncbi:hypothetical protein [Paracidovorax wautersii]|uniref:Uncharacterized protein n=1 Tax=Paracidovorax wautersii TaxID=1177982 RepID=A0A1I2HST2_9BURK|nr:hypothetical protein [Paracidovorax wautersii]SFF32503.1 hypothetical protein SAMN04489711_1312 [Paracidovorax wautersii]